jgi:hypothetical protein
MLHIWLRLDRTRVTVSLVALNRDDRSAARVSAQLVVDRFVSAAGRGPGDVAAVVRALGVQVLVDLSGVLAFRSEVVLTHE